MYNYMLFSGGFDSSSQLLHLCSQSTESIQPIFFNYGQKNGAHEEEAVGRVITYLQRKYDGVVQKAIVIRCFASLGDAGITQTLFPWSDAEPLTGRRTMDKSFCGNIEIENKNMVLFSLTFSYILSQMRLKKLQCGNINIYTGFRDNEMPDANKCFFRLLTTAMHIYHEEFSFNIHTMLDINHLEIYQRNRHILKSEQETKEFFDLTWSCFKPHPQDGKRCGTCSKCEMLELVLRKQHQLRDEGLLQ